MRRAARWRRKTFALATLAAACLGAAATPADDAATVRRIREAVQRGTGLLPESVERSTLLPGFYEVRAKGAVAYVDAGARHLVKGPVIDLSTGENLSLGAGAAPRIDPARLDGADAVTTVRGSGRRELVVFVDPNCTYCRELEPELERVGDVTVRRFVVPVLGPASVASARRVWCATDRAAAWRQAVSGSALPSNAAAPACDTAALDRNLALAKRLGVVATPTLVFGNGERVSAVMRTAQIEERLARPVRVLPPP